MKHYRVEACGVYGDFLPLYRSPLTSVDRAQRAGATRLLAEALDAIGCHPSEEEPLVAFFYDRIKDHHLVIPHVLTAFKTLVGV